MRERERQCRRAGFTFVEIMVVVALLLVLGGGFLTTLLTGQTSYLSADAYIQVQQEARRAFDNMVRELREAGGPLVNVTPANPGAILDFQVALGYDLDAGAGAIAGCPDAAVCWGAINPTTGTAQANWSVRYQQAAGPNGTTQLVRVVRDNTGIQQGTARVLANNVVAFPITSFTWNGAPTVRTITIALQIRTVDPRLPGGNQSLGILRSQVRLRNP